MLGAMVDFSVQDGCAIAQYGFMKKLRASFLEDLKGGNRNTPELEFF